jgi:hypothetical protein
MLGSYIFRANFGEPRQGEVRLSPDPMGQDFSGSCTVTSRNPLIQIGATNGIKSAGFDAKGVQQGLLSRACHCVAEPLATANFGEFFFYALG